MSDTNQVDRSNRCLTDSDWEHYDELKPNGQQKGYVVLCDEERAKGFVRPVRESYIHVGRNPEMLGVVLVKVGESNHPSGKACGHRTVIARSIAETYARDPYFYSGTFCVSCGQHYPLDEFVWEGTTEWVGS